MAEVEAPTNPDLRTPMAKRTDEELATTVVWKLWQSNTASGGMAQMVSKDAANAGSNAKRELMRRGMEPDAVDKIWTDWCSTSGYEIDKEHSGYKYIEAFFAIRELV